jgi:hypothetical protein
VVKEETKASGMDLVGLGQGDEKQSREGAFFPKGTVDTRHPASDQVESDALSKAGSLGSAEIMTTSAH